MNGRVPIPIPVPIRSALAEAWALVAPVDCAGCGAPDRALCPACGSGLRSRLRLAALELAPGRTVPIVAALVYEGVPRSVLLACKEQGRTELARPLAPALRTAIEAAWRGSDAELIVPVPGSRAAERRRGFQPVPLIARRAGLAVTPALRARGRAHAQKTLGLEGRLAVDEERWRVSPRVRGRRVVVIDDVVTSGATLRAAARALERAGAEVAGCAAIAATLRRAGASSILWRFMADQDEGPGDKLALEDYREGKEA